jgi:hypothetical protein
VVAEVDGQRPDVDAVVQQGRREVMPQGVEPVFPRDRDAGFAPRRMPVLLDEREQHFWADDEQVDWSA